MIQWSWNILNKNDISMMLNKCLIQWFWVHVTTKPRLHAVEKKFIWKWLKYEVSSEGVTANLTVGVGILEVYYVPWTKKKGVYETILLKELSKTSTNQHFSSFWKQFLIECASADLHVEAYFWGLFYSFSTNIFVTIKFRFHQINT